MALGESQDRSWVARGCEAISFLVCLLYACKAAVRIVSKFVEAAEVGGTWDMVLEPGWELIRSRKGNKTLTDS
jgi:hypothetical protein